MVRTFSFATALLVVLLLAGCTPGTGAATEEKEDLNATLAEYFAQGKEARAWMGTGTNHFFEGSDEAVNEVIADLYGMGAEEVRVTDGEKMDESSQGEIAATLVAKLPADEAKRKALFDYEAENTEDAYENRNRDYVEIVFD